MNVLRLSAEQRAKFFYEWLVKTYGHRVKATIIELANNNGGMSVCSVRKYLKELLKMGYIKEIQMEGTKQVYILKTSNKE